MTCLTTPWILRTLTARTYSSTPPSNRHFFISECIKIFYRQTQQPIWRFLHDPKRPGALGPRYRGQLNHTTDLPRTMSGLLRVNPTGQVFPDWVFLYFISKHCQKPADCLHLQGYLFNQLSKAPLHLQAPILIFAAAHFATWNMLLPLEKVVDKFLQLPHPIWTPVAAHPSPRILSLNEKEYELYFNLFLRALACIPTHTPAYSRYLSSTVNSMRTHTIPNELGPSALAPSPNPIKIHPDTYACLLLSTHKFILGHHHVSNAYLDPHSRILSPRLATWLRDQMALDGLEPSPLHLEALLRFWAKEAVGNSHPSSEQAVYAKKMVKELWEELHKMDQLEGAGVDGRADHVIRSNTLYLGAQGSILGVQELSALFEKARTAREEQAVPSNSSSSQVVGEVEEDSSLPAPPTLTATASTTTESEAGQDQPKEDSQTPTSPAPQPEPLLPRTSPHLTPHTLTASLHSFSNDRTISPAQFTSLFYRLIPLYGGPDHVPIAAHTAYLRGLMFRGSFEKARGWWTRELLGIKRTTRNGRNVKMGWVKRQELGQSEGGEEEGEWGEARKMDRMGLTVGLQILTRCGRPHEAFMVLERFAWKPTTKASFPSSPVELPEESPKPQQLDPPPIRLTSISITEWMVSLKRIARPDVVFRLWDYMYALYGVLHTSPTLNLLLQSARMAAVMDSRSVRTQLSNIFKLGYAKFKPTKPGAAGGEMGIGEWNRVLESSKKKRFEGKKEIEILVGRVKKAEAKPYKGGLWRGMRPEDAARQVFLQVLFGMEAEASSSSASSAADGNGNGGEPKSKGTRSAYKKVGLANVRAPACAVRKDWDSDAGGVGLGVGLVELKLYRFEYKPGPEMYDWVAPSASSSPAPSSSSSSSSTTQLQPRSLYPHLSLDDSNFLSYLSLLSVTNRTGEVALTMAWMRELGTIEPSEDTLALALVLWEEVSVEAPLVEVMARFTSRKDKGGHGDDVEGRREDEKGLVDVEAEGSEEAEERRRPSENEYERFVMWMEDWVGRKRMPDIEARMKWRGIVKGMREAMPRSRGDSISDSE